MTVSGFISLPDIQLKQGARLILSAGILAGCQTAAPSLVSQTARPAYAETVLSVGGDWDAADWSPDGQRLVLTQFRINPAPTEFPILVDAPIVLIEIPSGIQAEIPQPGTNALWSTDGNTLLISSAGNQGEDPHLWLYWLADQRVQSFPDPGGRPSVWLGDRLLYDTTDGLASVAVQAGDPITLGQPEMLARFHLNQAETKWVSAAPDLQTFLIYARLGQTVGQPITRWWLDTADGTSTELNLSIGSIGTCCAWSPDGQHLALLVHEPESALSIIDRTGDNLRTLVRASDIGDGAFISMDLSPSGEVIAFEWSSTGEGFPFSNNQIYLVNITTGSWSKVTERAGTYRYPDWSPNGDLIAYVNEDGGLGVMRVTEP